jgi:2-desacetyl-2-hydroxyethyl bacteriochlorophyllide A dehydrogenase
MDFIGEMMKALIITEPGSVEVREVELPAFGADDVLVRSYAVGISESDVELYKGRRPEGYYRYPVIPGHEWSGVVVEVGKHVRGIAVGNKVVAESILFCGVCSNCREGATNLCEAGYDESGFTRPGGMAEYVAVPARLVHVLPDDTILEEAALLEPTARIAHSFLRAHPRPGSVVAVVGTGTSGLLALQLARLYSPSALVVVGLRADRLEFARQFGATHTINLGREDAEERMWAISAGRGADLVFEGDGHTQAIIEALHLARRGGSVILKGLAGAGALLGVESELLALNQLSVHGIFGANTTAWTYGVQLFRSGLLNLALLISQRFSLDEYQDALDILEKRQGQTSPGTRVLFVHEH